MATAPNGNVRWLLWTAGIIMSCIITAITFLGTNVIANERSSRDRDSNIKVEVVAQERRIDKKLDKIQTSVNTNHTEVLLAVQSIQKDIERYHAND